MTMIEEGYAPIAMLLAKRVEHDAKQKRGTEADLMSVFEEYMTDKIFEDGLPKSRADFVQMVLQLVKVHRIPIDVATEIMAQAWLASAKEFDA